MHNVCIPIRYRQAKILADGFPLRVVSFVLNINVLELETRMFSLNVSPAPPNVTIVRIHPEVRGFAPLQEKTHRQTAYPAPHIDDAGLSRNLNGIHERASQTHRGGDEKCVVGVGEPAHHRPQLAAGDSQSTDVGRSSIGERPPEPAHGRPQRSWEESPRNAAKRRGWLDDASQRYFPPPTQLA